jgi:hypothetical protein
MRRKAWYGLWILAVDVAIVAICWLAIIFESLGPSGCGIEGVCGAYGYSAKWPVIFTVAVGLLVVIVVDYLIARQYLKRFSPSGNVTADSTWKNNLSIFGPLIVILAILILSFLGDKLYNRIMLKSELSKIPVAVGCHETARYYASPGWTLKATCDKSVTNAQLHQEISVDLQPLGYQFYFDNSYGSSSYNQYQFGLRTDKYEAIYLFYNQDISVSSQSLGTQGANGYTLKLYKN